MSDEFFFRAQCQKCEYEINGLSSILTPELPSCEKCGGEFEITERDFD